LRRVAITDIESLRKPAFDSEAFVVASAIVDDVRRRGEIAVREHAVRLGDIAPDESMFATTEEIAAAEASLRPGDVELLERTKSRIEAFAEAQRSCISDLSTSIQGGRAGHTILPVERAGCYAPGGRFPLPSSLLMTAVTARVAGVSEIVVASPKPTPIMLAAARVAGVDRLLKVGGAQAIAALAYGAGEIPRCDALVGPGNKYVTAAKQLVAGHVAIDMLAGPSELLVIADDTANAEVCSADLLAQAEHDVDAVPMLICLSEQFAKRVEAAIDDQLRSLPTADTARAALANGFILIVQDPEEAARASDRIAPEHLHLNMADPDLSLFTNYGSLFVGAKSAEVFGDYGAGPNHTLPTGGTARSFSGLSVFTFLRMPTWLELTDPALLTTDVASLARLEALEGHARAAEQTER
jgi:phosphoribosyl-ATP pyrophosphohydrolase/phosphoribosyl-AMP cyclohydrolase/histidinol dehydrogenase